jgi:hypothetical protein
VCYIIHYHTFILWMLYCYTFLRCFFVAEFISLYYKIKTIFTCTALIFLTEVNGRINQTSILIPTMILLSFANLKFAELLNWYCFFLYSFKYIWHWDDFQWHRYIQSSVSLPVDWLTNTMTAGMTYQEASLRLDTLVDTDPHQKQ